MCIPINTQENYASSPKSFKAVFLILWLLSHIAGAVEQSQSKVLLYTFLNQKENFFNTFLYVIAYFVLLI